MRNEGKKSIKKNVSPLKICPSRQLPALPTKSRPVRVLFYTDVENMHENRENKKFQKEQGQPTFWKFSVWKEEGASYIVGRIYLETD